MFHSNRFLNFVLWLSLGAMASGCTGGGCTSCSYTELPAGGLPPAQTIEGGAQVRMTAAGMNTVEELVEALFTDLVGDGFCLGPQYFIDTGDTNFGAKVGACFTDTCSGGGSGCDIGVSLTSFTSRVDGQELTLAASFDAATVINIDAQAYLLGETVVDEGCALDVSLTDALVSFRIRVDVDPGTGELVLDFNSVDALDLTGFVIEGCDDVGAALGTFVDLITSTADFLTDELGLLFGPVLGQLTDMLLATLLPDPLGIEGVLDIGATLAGFSPSTSAALETKLIPGGYAYLENDGLSLGIITGLNADRDPTTRAPSQVSEAARCVPPIEAPDLGASPISLSNITRSYGNPFTLAPAQEFRGSPDPAMTDVAIGASETMLDLMGHHLVASGALCLAVSTESIAQLNLGTIGLLVPSLAELGSPSGKDPLMLVTRPLEAIDFTIGTGQSGDPALAMELRDFEVDFYAFIFERWVRGFTVRLNATVGVDLEFTVDGDGNPAVIPILSGLEAENLNVSILNGEFLREEAGELEAVFPTLLDLIIPMVVGSIGEVALPSFAGFTLNNLELRRVQTSEDDFLAILGDLGATEALLGSLAGDYPTLKARMRSLVAVAPQKVITEATLGEVRVPTPDAIRRSLLEEDDSQRPSAKILAPATDGQGRELEYTWSLDGRLWRPFVSGGMIEISDRTFAVQGRYAIHLRARRVGEYASLDDSAEILEVLIDSAPPAIDGASIRVIEDKLFIPVSDLVSEPVRIAFSAPGRGHPQTGWHREHSVSLAVIDGVARRGGVKIWAQDAAGNRNTLTVPYSISSSGGCNAAAGNGDLALYSLAGLLGLLGVGRRRRRRLTAVAGCCAALWFVSSCGASHDSCELNSDCTDGCADGEVGICIESGECLCTDEIPLGQIGQYASMAVGSESSIHLAAYNATHGDLMVAQWSGVGRVESDAWTFLDGVPEGPVATDEDDARGGIADEGDDVGLYTDIVSHGSWLFISYFDQTHAAIKVAVFDGEAWSSHIIESGSAGNPEGGVFTTIGPYSSITVGPDGKPNIAYMTQQGNGDSVTTEVRWATARSSSPRSSADWDMRTIDEATVPASTNLPIPSGTGLFIDSAHLSDGSAAITYYDRSGGRLRLAIGNDDSFVLTTLDGDGDGLDVGWYPSITADSADVLHLSYVDAINNDLLYINTFDSTPELVDDGYRLVGMNSEGLPKPEFQFVGDDSALVMSPTGPVIAYQNATTHSLLVAQRTDEGWARDTLAGNENPFQGGYGFYADATTDDGDVLISTWVLDQPGYDAWIEVFRARFGIE